MSMLAVLAASAAVQAAQTPVITDPDWLVPPNGEDVGRFYPQLDTLLGIEGWAVIACDVDPGGALRNCKAVDESPKQLGFGDAAVGMAAAFQMKPKKLDGTPTQGEVRIPIRFALPKASPPGPETSAPSTPPPPSQQAVLLGQRVLVAKGYPAYLRSRFERVAELVLSANSPGVSLDTRKHVADLIRQVSEEQIGRTMETASSVLAGYTPEATLAVEAQFFETPEGGTYFRQTQRVNKATREGAKAGYDRVKSVLRCVIDKKPACPLSPPDKEPPASDPEKAKLAGEIVALRQTRLSLQPGMLAKAFAPKDRPDLVKALTLAEADLRSTYDRAQRAALEDVTCPLPDPSI